MPESLDKYGQMSEKDTDMMNIPDNVQDQPNKSQIGKIENEKSDVFQKIEEGLYSVIQSLAEANELGATKNQMEKSIAKAMHTLTGLQSEVVKPEYSTAEDYSPDVAQQTIELLIGELYPGHVFGASERQMSNSVQTTINRALDLFDTSDTRNEKLRTEAFSR